MFQRRVVVSFELLTYTAYTVINVNVVIIIKSLFNATLILMYT